MIRSVTRLIPLAALAAVAVTAAPAAATTSCVPAFHPACPDTNGNVAVATVPAALAKDRGDGTPDKVIIAAGTYTHTTTIEATGSDALEVVGAGPQATVLTTTGTLNAFAVYFGLPSTLKVRDLTVRIPDTFPDTVNAAGAGIYARRGTFENVDVESRNPGSTGVVLDEGGSFRDGALYGSAGGGFGDGIQAIGAGPASQVIERSTIDNVVRGVISASPGVPVSMDRVAITNAAQVGAGALFGGNLSITNSLITSAGIGVQAASNAADFATATLANITLVGLPGATTGLSVGVGNSDSAEAVGTLTDSIVRGFPKTYVRSAPVSPASGNATVELRASNYPPVGTSTGDGALVVGPGNIDADPLFAGPSDFRLLAGSPSIDAATPATVLGFNLDLAGAPREIGGRRDQGAYEYQPPAPALTPTTPAPPATPAAAKDTTAPRISGLKVLRPLSRAKGGRIRMTVSEGASVVLTFTRTSKAGKPRRVTVKVRVPAGTTTVRVRAKKLAAAGYRLTVVATDAAGNRSAAVRRTLRVRA